MQELKDSEKAAKRQLLSTTGHGKWQPAIHNSGVFRQAP